MTITLEQIDELRRRVNVSFEDAREALQECNGDLVEAIVYLEKNGKIKSTNSSEPKDSLWDKFKALVNKGNNTRFIMYKRDKTIIDLSVTISIIIAALAFHIAIVGLVVALITGYRFKFVKNNGEDMKVNETLDKMHNNIDNMKKKFADDVLKDESAAK
jgi:predicted RND superfamily exporter protein